MRRRANRAGFTIVEVMIVLAVTGALFVAIAGTLAGKQRNSEFTQSVNEVRSQLQQIISEVQAGYYANKGDFNCNAGGNVPVISFGSGTEQGKNSGCIFLGKVIQFNAEDGYRVFPVAGLQSAQNFLGSKPTVIHNSGVNDESSLVPYKFGLTVVAMRYSGVSSAGSFAVFSSFDDTDAEQGSNQQADIYGLPSPTRNEATADDAVVSIKNDLSTVLGGTTGSLALNPPGGVRICFKSGGNDNFGLITIGENNRQVSVELQITTNSNCTGLI